MQNKTHKQGNKRPILYSILMLFALQISACSAVNSPFGAVNKILEEEERAEAASEAPARVKNLNNRREKIQGYLAQAGEAWEAQDLDRLETIYQQLEAYDPGNLRAKQGLINIAMARKHVSLLQEAKTLISQDEIDDDKLAQEKLQQILLENPNHMEAKTLYTSLSKKAELAKQEKARVKLAYNEPLSLEFRDIKLGMLFEALSKITNISFILDKDVKTSAKASIFAKNMAFTDVLDLVCQTNKLDKKVLSATSVIIYPNKTTSKREYVDLSVRNFPLEYADAKQVSATLSKMLNIRSMQVDERLSSIMIKESPAILALAEKLIDTLDRPDPEVMLEMEVLEVRRSKLQDLGIDVPTRLGVPIPADGLTWEQLRATTANSLLVEGGPGLTFLANDANVNLLANPRIRVRNKETAQIHVGEKVPVFTANIASTGVSSQTVQYIDAGLKLEAIPTIHNSGDVTIKINLNVNSIGEEITNGQSSAFRVGTRTASTQLRLRDGETQILAGLIDDQDRVNVNKIPGLGDLPLLGRLFSKNRDNSSKTEIVLSITPHIVRDKVLGEAQQNQYWLGSQSNAGRASPSPAFQKGKVPFSLPKPAKKPVPAAKEDKPASLNIPLPSGFNLGGGLNN